MAQDPQQHAQDYGLSHDVAAEFEAEEGPALEAQHGRTRARVPERADHDGHGPKTSRRIRETINRRNPQGTH